MTAIGGVTVLAFLATYLIHSTLLLGAAWVLTRYVVHSEAWRETLWKAAVLGGLATSVVAQAAPWTPLRVALPALPAEVSRSSIAAIPTASPGTRPAAFPDPAAADGAGAAAADGTGAAAAGVAGAADDGRIDGTAEGNAVPELAGSSTDGSVRESRPISGRDGGSTSSRGGWTAAGVRMPSWPTVILSVWSGVALLLLGRLMWRHVRLGRVLRDRRVVTEPGPLSLLAELRRMAGVWVPIGLTSTSSVASPLVLGRREICVPERFLTELGADEQRAALAHELGHLARRDPAWLLGAMLLECVFFFQPLQRIARLRLRETAEYRADIWAVRVAGGRLSLARCLAEVAAWVAPAQHPGLAERVAMAEGGSPLHSRVSRLLEKRPEAEPRAGLRVAVGVALVVAGAVLAPSVGMAGAGEPAGADADSHVENVDFEITGPVENAGPLTDGSGQDTLEVLRFDGPAREGTSFVARLNAAGRDAGPRSYWVAYVVPGSAAGGDLVIDSEPWSVRSIRGRAVAEVLGIDGASGGGGGILFAQLQPEGAATRVVRLAVRAPHVGLALAGRVYWLGRAEPEESFRWLRDIYTAVEDPRIRETAVDMIGFHPTASAEAFLRRVIDSAEGRNVREQAVESLTYHPSDEVLALLVTLAQTESDRMIGGEATETLGELDHPGAAGALRDLVRNGAADIREEALESLVQRGDTALAELLLEIALHDPDADMRNEAVECMAELPPGVAVPLLRRVVFEGDEAAARQAVETLGDVRTAEAFAVLEEVVERGVSEVVAFEAVESIAEFEAQRAAPLLERLASTHPSLEVHREVMEQLLDLSPGGIDGETLLSVALHDSEPAMRRDAVELLAELPAAEAVPLLRRVVFESGDRTSEREATESLGDVGTPEALEVLDEILARNPGEDASLQAVESIAEKFSRDVALPRLTRIARDHPSSRVRREALDHLRDLGGGPRTLP